MAGGIPGDLEQGAEQMIQHLLEVGDDVLLLIDCVQLFEGRREQTCTTSSKSFEQPS